LADRFDHLKVQVSVGRYGVALKNEILIWLVLFDKISWNGETAMFFFTMWGGAEVRPKDPDNIVITVWGGTSILLPTLAEKIARLKKVREDEGEITDAVIRRTNVITVMGGTAYKIPTIAQEIEQMKQLKDSGSIPEQEMFELWQEAIRREDLDLFESLTIMGGAANEVPGRKEELKDLERIATRGIINGRELEDFRALLQKNVTGGTEEMQNRLLRLLRPVSSGPAAIEAPKVHSALIE
jgi:hypothetical protein